MDIKGWPLATIVGGFVAMRDGEIQDKPIGKAVRFWDVPIAYQERGSVMPPPPVSA